jgi:hypothetical protein
VIKRLRIMPVYLWFSSVIADWDAEKPSEPRL